MIEIVFSDSACGSLKMAQHHGEGKYTGGCVGVILSKKDGSEPTAEEYEAAQKEVEARCRVEWEEGKPMGGDPRDVFGFSLGLSIGDISNQDFATNRQKTFNRLWSIYPDDPSDDLKLVDQLPKTLDTVLARAANGEALRIWYSDTPDDLCGLYWLMTELEELKKPLGTVYVVKLPEYEYLDNTVVSHRGWGEVSPGDWHRYTALAQPTTPIFRRQCAMRWRMLQKENAPLRAVISGRLHGVPETFYDHFIRREIDFQPFEFMEAEVVGRVLGVYELGIGDAWIALRIEKIMEEGTLVVVSDVPKDRPIYHRMLQKVYDDK